MPPAPRERAGALARFLKKNAGLIALLVVFLGVLYLYYGVPRGAQRTLDDRLEDLKGDSAGGLYLAYVGTIFLVSAQVYTFVRRTGHPVLTSLFGGVPLWLNIHITLALLGFVAVVLHAGFPFSFRADLTKHAFAGLLTALLLVEIGSGVFGRYLYRRLPLMKRVFRYWKATHVSTTILFFAVLLIHILKA